MVRSQYAVRGSVHELGVRLEDCLELPYSLRIHSSEHRCPRLITLRSQPVVKIHGSWIVSEMQVIVQQFSVWVAVWSSRQLQMYWVPRLSPGLLIQSPRAVVELSRIAAP